MKNVVITGSTRGIGFFMAAEFLKEGCNVTLPCRGCTLYHDGFYRVNVYFAYSSWLYSGYCI